jgi:hypothetical protein
LDCSYGVEEKLLELPGIANGLDWDWDEKKARTEND